MSIHLTLDRIRVLANYLPAYTRPTCHIAGTNGKGSVASILSSILLASTPPLSVGRFNSPHLVSVYDCIVINGKSVTQDVYESTRSEVVHADQVHGTGVSSFELLTLTALLIFERAHVDVAVIEVGMGGRLDATNIIPDDCILVSSLAAVDLDHQAVLGATVTDIAREKAGIARRGKPFVIGPQAHAEVFDIVKDAIEAVGGELFQASPGERRQWDEAMDGPLPSGLTLLPSSFSRPPPQPVSVSVKTFDDSVHARLPLYGDHQLNNLGLAVGMVSALLTRTAYSSTLPFDLRERITRDSIARGIESTSWPGRLSFHTVTLPSSPKQQLIVLADGAHNPASSTTLSAYISHVLALAHPDPPSHPRRIALTLILGLSHSPPKTPMQTLSPILTPLSHPYLQLTLRVACVQFSPPEGMPWITPVPSSELRVVASGLAPTAEVWDGEGEGVDGVGRALEWAAARQGESEGFVVVAGSLYLVADFYRIIMMENTAAHP